MEEIQLLEAVEKYIHGEMSAEERTIFEQLRKNNPELDQLVVEHTMFLNRLDHFGEWKDYKSTLNDIHTQLKETGEIKDKAPKAVVRELWRRYKRVMAVASIIAGITTFVIASIATYYNREANKKTVEELNRQVDKKTQVVLNAVDRKIDQRTSPRIPETVKKLSGGTGFLIDSKGYLLTNAHVIKSLVVVQNSKGQEFNASVIYLDHATDLAILKIEDEEFKSLSSLPYSISKNNVDLGESLFTLGYPRNEIVYNEGYMSAKTGYNGDTLSFQIGLSANPGNSGGPVFNKNGEVIGIINTRQIEAEGVVFAVTAKNIYRALDEIKKEDSTIKNVKLPITTQLKGIDRAQQIKKIEDCVFMVKSY